MLVGTSKKMMPVKAAQYLTVCCEAGCNNLIPLEVHTCPKCVNKAYAPGRATA